MKYKAELTTSTLLFMTLMLPLHGAPALSPPLLPSLFSVRFEETLSFKDFLLIKNTGAMYYDFHNSQQRMDHDRGQVNNFCWNQHLSDDDTMAPCRLLFSNDSALYVHFPLARNCCRLCTRAQGCGPLSPDWLKGGKYLGEERIAGSDCYGWGKPGFVAAEDVWFATQSSRPCRYHEVVFPVTHNLTFQNSTYSQQPLPKEIFAVPDYCHRKCPNPLQDVRDLAVSLLPKYGVQLLGDA